MQKLIRITTVPQSLNSLLRGQLKYLSQYYEVVGVSSYSPLLDEVSKRENVRTVSVEMQRNIKPLSDLKSLFQLIKLFRKEKPFIVHANTPKASLLSMIAAFICRVPHRIYTVTGLRFETTSGYMRRLLIVMEQITCVCATKVIPEGNGVKNTLISNKITKKTLRIIFNGNINGINLKHFNRSEIYNLSEKVYRDLELDNCFTFCFVGRLVGDKGINELVYSFNRLYKEYSNIRLILVGRMEPELDPLKNETINMINSMSSILAVGHQEDVRPYLYVSDVFAFGSYREGFPNVVLQAGAMGLPCIVTDINGCNEIIINECNGLIISKKNTEEFYQAMKRLYLDADLRTSMTTCARGLIASRFEQEKVWSAILEEYKLLDKNYV